MSGHDIESEDYRVNVQAGAGSKYTTLDGDLSIASDQVCYVDTSGKRIEIPADGIVAFEYEPATIDKLSAYFGILSLIPGVLAVAILTGIFTPSLPDSVHTLLPIVALVGIGGAVMGFIDAVYYARHTAVIHTAATSYTFISNDAEMQRIQDVL